MREQVAGVKEIKTATATRMSTPCAKATVSAIAPVAGVAASRALTHIPRVTDQAGRIRRSSPVDSGKNDPSSQTGITTKRDLTLSYAVTAAASPSAESSRWRLSAYETPQGVCLGSALSHITTPHHSANKAVYSSTQNLQTLQRKVADAAIHRGARHSNPLAGGSHMSPITPKQRIHLTSGDLRDLRASIALKLECVASPRKRQLAGITATERSDSSLYASPLRDDEAEARDTEIGIAVYTIGPGLYHSSLIVNGYEWHFWEQLGVQMLPRFTADTGSYATTRCTAAPTERDSPTGLIHKRGSATTTPSGPKVSVTHIPLHSHINLGTVDISPMAIAKIIEDLATSTHTTTSYDLIHNNCNNFVETMVQRLGILHTVPGWINRPARLASSVCAKFPSFRKAVDLVLGRQIEDIQLKPYERDQILTLLNQKKEGGLNDRASAVTPNSRSASAQKIHSPRSTASSTTTTTTSIDAAQGIATSTQQEKEKAKPLMSLYKKTASAVMDSTSSCASTTYSGTDRKVVIRPVAKTPDPSLSRALAAHLVPAINSAERLKAAVKSSSKVTIPLLYQLSAGSQESASGMMSANMNSSRQLVGGSSKTAVKAKTKLPQGAIAHGACSQLSAGSKKGTMRFVPRGNFKETTNKTFSKLSSEISPSLRGVAQSLMNTRSCYTVTQ